MKKTYRENKILFVLFLVALISVSLNSVAIAARDLPDDNLAHPVLIYSNNGFTGSGFYLNNGDNIYLVTARHVLFSEATTTLSEKLEPQDYLVPRKFKFRLAYHPEKMTLEFEGVMTRDEMALLNDVTKSKQFKKAIEKLYEKSQHLLLRFNTADLLSYSVPQQLNGSEDDENIVTLQLSDLLEKGFVRYHPSADVAIIKLGGVKTSQKDPSHFTIDFAPGINTRGHGLVAMPKEHTKMFKDVLVGNKIYLFGYPTSITEEDPALDIRTPLLRGGIVAGKNKALKNIILDSPVYYGNSGGLVLEVEQTALGVTNYRGIGLISQLVPFQPNGPKFQNSGYSVAVPMDFVFQLIAEP